jgi:hypothetical protein
LVRRVINGSLLKCRYFSVVALQHHNIFKIEPGCKIIFATILFLHAI